MQMYEVVYTKKECAVWRSVHWGANFFNLSFTLTS